MTYEIPRYNLEWLKGKIEKLNKKAEKLGCEPITLEVIDEKFEPKNDEGTEFEKFLVVEIKGQKPMINGWTFVATLEHSHEHGNIVRTVPGESVPEEYRTVEPRCDHCQTRRYRKDTFLVRNEQGEIKQVGRNCLKDFLGHSDPHHIAEYAEMLIELEEWANDYTPHTGVRDDRYIDLKTYLTYVAECIRRFGWVSRVRAYEYEEESTANRALREMFPFNPRYREVFPGEEAKQLAEAALVWAREEMEPNNDYLHNLKVLVSSGVIEWRDTGLAASIIIAYQKAKEKKKQREKSEHIGEVGERIEVDVVVEKVHVFENDWGTTKLHRFKDDKGNVIVWFASNELLEEGKNYKIRGTVREHSEYRGVKQTVLTRCKVIA